MIFKYKAPKAIKIMSFDDIKDNRVNIILTMFNEITNILEEKEDLERIVGLMNQRKFYRKFVDEVFQKQKGRELSIPDFDYIYQLYFEQKTEIETLKKLLDNKCDQCISKDRAEGMKDFWLKAKATAHTLNSNEETFEVVYVEDADKLLEELIGDKT